MDATTVATTIPIMALELVGATLGEVGVEVVVVWQHSDGQLEDLHPQEVRVRGQPPGLAELRGDNVFIIYCYFYCT